MQDLRDETHVGHGLTGWVGRLPTGAKLFLILSFALLPLAVIALLAALQNNRIADIEKRARLRLAATKSARALSIELVSDMTALQVAANALDIDGRDAPSCARIQGVFAQQMAGGARFVVAKRNGGPLCGSDFRLAESVTGPDRGDAFVTRIVSGQALVVAVTGSSGHVVAKALFPPAFLARIGQPSDFSASFGSALVDGATTLPLVSLAGAGPLDRIESIRAPIGMGELALQMDVPSAKITWPLIIAMSLPLVMWAAAAGIGWFVVDRLLIRPLRQLRRQVADYRPGQMIDPGAMSTVPAQEIRELGATFREISRTVMLHEAGLAEGVIRQTRLTREVHHRVKNNLQVISSLINFHSRGAKSNEASAAYASIQRRVDALAVVHRNHFAELEVNRGLSLRSIISDLASNFRITAPEAGSGFAIVLDIDPSLVSQDIATAVAFLITELIELAILCQPDTLVRISTCAGSSDSHATLRISAPALIESDRLRLELAERYGRVIEGLARQLRTKLRYDSLVGAYEVEMPIVGRD